MSVSLKEEVQNWILKFSSSVHLSGFGDMKLLQAAIMNNSIHCSFNLIIKNFILADFRSIPLKKHPFINYIIFLEKLEVTDKMI